MDPATGMLVAAMLGSQWTGADSVCLGAERRAGKKGD